MVSETLTLRGNCLLRWLYLPAMNSHLLRTLCSVLAVTALGASAAHAQSTTRVSVDSAGLQGNDNSFALGISAAGRFVAFSSRANNLVPGDTNGVNDVFVHDRQAGQTTRVSVDSGGLQGNAASEYGSISSDGHYVAFDSRANNLVSGDTNGVRDVFVHDRQMGQTTRVSVDSGGLQGNADTWFGGISSDGRYVAFISIANNLVSGDTNGVADAFVHDRQTGQTTRVSVDSGGLQGNAASGTAGISSDGRFVAFSSRANNLVPGDTNGVEDIFIHDRQTAQTTRVSVDSGGLQGNSDSWYPSISSDGRFVAFNSAASNLVPGDSNGTTDVFVHDRRTGQTMRVSVDSGGLQGNAGSGFGSISFNGRYVAYKSFASNLVSGDTNNVPDIFMYDLQSGQTTLVSLNSGGVQGNDESDVPFISNYGGFIAFGSFASNLVPGDTNGAYDVFVRDLQSSPTLALQGTCPGPITLTVGNATANGSIAFVYGPAGVFVKPTPPCQGLVLSLSSPTLAAMRTANGAGAVTLNATVPPGACGLTVQAVDAATCVPSNAVVL